MNFAWSLFSGHSDCNTISSRLWINILKHLETWWEYSTLTVYITKYPTIAIHCCYLNYIVMQGVCSKIALKMDKNSSQRAISELLGGIVIKCGPICYNHILAEVFSFTIKVFFNCCLLCEVKIVLSSVLWSNSCNCFFSFHLCAGFSHFSENYLNQFPPGEFLPAMSNFHLLVFLATSNILPLKVMFICWLQVCDEITANELQRDAL